MIRIENITKSFERNKERLDAVNDVSMHVEKGDFIAITGHSGCGKTTLFNMIGGLIVPTSGKIFIKGTEITAMDKKEMAQFRNAHIGYVLQGYSLLGNYSIIDNVCMPLYISGNKESFINKAMHLLETIGLEELADEYPAELSGGEMRRVAIARAMMSNPEVVLADEPTSNLDPANSIMVMQMLKDLSKSGTTVLFSTHELQYLEYANRSFSMEHGRIN